MSIVSTLVVRVMASVADFEKEMATLEKTFDKVGAQMQDVGASLTKLTAPILAVGAYSVKAFGDFDDAMTKSLAIMGDVSDEMQGRMTQAALDVASTTKFSATEAAESYFFLASAGLDAAASIEALPVVAAFAQAGNFDMARATDLLTDAQSALGMTIRDDVIANMENMIRVSDVLVKANTLSNATVEQFSESLTNKAGAALRLVNKDVEEGVAVLAAFADQGIKGADAGTKLDIVLRDLQVRALANTGAIRDHNGEMVQFRDVVFDSSGNMRNMADIIGSLEVGLAGMSDEQTRATLKLIGFQDRSVSAILTLIGMSEAIRDYEQKLRTAGGITQEVADKQMASLWAQAGLLWDQFNVLAVQIGALLAPALIGLMDVVRGLLPHVVSAVAWFADLPQPVQMAAIAFTALATAAGPAIWALGTMATTLAPLVGQFGPWIAAIWNSKDAVVAALVHYNQWGNVLPVLSGAMTSTTSALGAMVTGIGTAISSITLKVGMLTTWSGLMTAIGTVTTTLSGILSGVFFGALSIVTSPIALLVAGVSALIPIFHGFIDALMGGSREMEGTASESSALVRIFGDLKDIIVIGAQFLTDYFIAAIKVAYGALYDFGQWIGDIVNGFMEWIGAGGLLGAALSKLGDIIGGVANALRLWKLEKETDAQITEMNTKALDDLNASARNQLNILDPLKAAKMMDADASRTAEEAERKRREELDRISAAQRVAAEEAKRYADSVNALVSELSGMTVAEDAAKNVQLMLDAFRQLPPLSDLSRESLERIHGTMGTLITSVDALGDRAPASMRALADAARQTQADITAVYLAHLESLQGVVSVDLSPYTAEWEDVADGVRASLATLPPYAWEVEQGITDAFSRAGLKTQTELQATADAALRDFEIIRDSGLATTEQLDIAWSRYTQAATAAGHTFRDHWLVSLQKVADGFLQLGSIIGGVFGTVFNWIGNVVNGFSTLYSSVGTIYSGISQLGSAFGNLGGGMGGFLSGLPTLLSGFGSIVGAASAAIGLISSLAGAIAGLFQSEETKLVSPNRDLFFGQFGSGDYADVRMDLIRAAQMIYGVDHGAAFDMTEHLILALYNAKTWAEFDAAQRAYADFFLQAGVRLKIFDQSGIGTLYTTSVFDDPWQTFNQTSTFDTSAFDTSYTMPAFGEPLAPTGTSYYSPQSPSSGECCAGVTVNINGDVHIGDGADAEQAGRDLARGVIEEIMDGGDLMSLFRQAMCEAQG